MSETFRDKILETVFVSVFSCNELNLHAHLGLLERGLWFSCSDQSFLPGQLSRSCALITPENRNKSSLRNIIH